MSQASGEQNLANSDRIQVVFVSVIDDGFLVGQPNGEYHDIHHFFLPPGIVALGGDRAGSTASCRCCEGGLVRD